MRILIAAIGHFGDHPGGSSKVVLDEAEELVRRGEEVWILAPGAPTLPEHEYRDGIHYLRYVPAEVAPWNPARAFEHRKAACAVLARHLPKVDAVHGHVPLSYEAALEFYGASIYSAYTIHSPVKMEMAIVWKNAGFLRYVTGACGLPILNRIEAKCLRRSQALTALSQYTIDCIGKIHGEKLDRRIQLTPGWVDSSRFVPVEDRAGAKAQLGWPTDFPVLFTLRRLVPRMGLDRLLTACHLLLSEGLKFQLVLGGSGPLRDKLEEQSRVLGLTNTVRFIGRVADRVLPLAYAACDAFVLPTAELECFGIIALEALSAGRPVLATPVGAIPEIVRKFDASWLARSAKAEDVADLLREFLTGRLPEHLPSELHGQICREYSREQVLGKYIETALGEVLGK